MRTILDRFDRLDTSLNHWLVAHSIALLRLSLGLVFLAFGALKFFPGLSPIEELATRTTTTLTFGLVSPSVGLAIIAALEVAIGLCFVTGRFLRVGVWLMGAQMLGAMSPLVLFAGELFAGSQGAFAPTLVAQYIIKDIILVAAAMVIASTWTGARIVAEPKSLRSTLHTTATPRMIVVARSEDARSEDARSGDARSGDARSGEPSIPDRLRRAENYRSYAGSGTRGSSGKGSSGGPPSP